MARFASFALLAAVGGVAWSGSVTYLAGGGAGSGGSWTVCGANVAGMCAWSPDACDSASYASPDAPFAFVPFQSAPLVASLAARGPASHAPTTPALQGALAQIGSWHGSNGTN